MIVISGHATRYDGRVYEFPTISLLEVLETKKKNFIYLRHSIDGKACSQILIFKKGILISEQNLPIFSKIAIIRYTWEFLLNIFICIYYSAKNKKRISYIGVDPLNALAGNILTKIRISKLNIFYSVDYSSTRFNNRFLNNMYLFIDKWVSLNSNEIWNVSSRILRIRKKQGVPDERNRYLPNVPVVTNLQTVKKKNKHTLITLGVIDKQLDYINLFAAIDKLKKKFPKIKLRIIGNGPLEQVIKEYVHDSKMDSFVEFKGFLSHEKALKEISQSGIGLALYNKKWSFNFYGDSMKCREYFLYGLPVLTTNTHSTVEDIKKFHSGIIVPIGNIDAYYKAIKNIIGNYTTFSKNALILGNKYIHIHEDFLNSIII